MGDWKTFADKIKELLKSKNLSAAKEELAIGLEKIPNQINLLIIATDVYRASGDREKSLEYSEIEHSKSFRKLIEVYEKK